MFKSPNQRKFLFAQDKDKQKGINPSKSSPNSFPTSRPPEMTKPFKAFSLGTLAAKEFKPSMPGNIKPTSNPSVIPSLPGLPKFGKTKQYLKSKKAF